MISRRLITEFKKLSPADQADHLAVLQAIASRDTTGEAAAASKPGKKRGPKKGWKKAASAAASAGATKTEGAGDTPTE